MKKLLLFIGVFLLLNFNCAYGVETDSAELCRKKAQAELAKTEIRYRLGKISYIDKFSTKELAAKFPKTAAKNPNILGFTKTSLEYSVSLHIYKYKMPDGSFCVYPESVRVDVGYKNPVVYLSSNLKKGSCAYKRTLRHEWQHLAFMYIYFQQYINEIKLKLFSETRTIVTKNLETADDLLTQSYYEAMAKIHSTNMERLMNFQKQLDSLENYQNESNLCRSDK